MHFPWPWLRLLAFASLDLLGSQLQERLGYSGDCATVFATTRLNQLADCLQWCCEMFWEPMTGTLKIVAVKNSSPKDVHTTWIESSIIPALGCPYNYIYNLITTRLSAIIARSFYWPFQHKHPPAIIIAKEELWIRDPQKVPHVCCLISPMFWVSFPQFFFQYCNNYSISNVI